MPGIFKSVFLWFWEDYYIISLYVDFALRNLRTAEDERQKMKSRKVKKISKLKKGHGLVSLLLFLVFSVVVAVLLADCMITAGYYFLQSKIASEYETISYMSRIYDLGLQGEDGPDVWAILDEQGTEYIIRDAEGNQVYGSDDNTCGKDGDYARISNIEGEVEIYPDTEHEYISVTHGSVRLNIIKFLDLITKDDNTVDHDIVVISESEGSIPVLFGAYMVSYSSDQQIRLPFWMGFDVKDGGEKFLGKGSVSIMLGDLAIMGIAVAAIGVLLVFAFFLFLSSMIGNMRSQSRVRKVLFGDLVTGGHNQIWFTYYGEKLLRAGVNAKKTYAVVDIHVVKYNSFCMCHSVADGEDILRQIDACIKKQLKWGEIFAHGSSAEFHLLLKVDDQEHFMSRLRALISELEKVEQAHAFTYHLGISMIPPFRKENGNIVRRRWVDLEQECNNAATARKTIDGNDGSDIAFFDVKLIEERKWQDQVEEHCRKALENEDFIVFYQPKYDPKFGELKGAEALIRWRSSSPELAAPGTLIPPGKFIPIFETNGFITEIDHYMLRHVAADQKKWLDSGFKCVPVSVNVSRAHFIEPDLAEQIKDIVDGAGAPRSLIEIELTESAFFDDKNALIRTINKLKEYGFSVSMDDFGSGYSSLNSLKDMPLDVLKIDAEFFRGDHGDERGRTVVSETIKLARSLNMRTVAEGVEIFDQVDFLARQECDMIQGYYFEKPVPGDKYEEMMRKHISDKPAASVASASEMSSETGAPNGKEDVTTDRQADQNTDKPENDPGMNPDDKGAEDSAE